MSKLYVLSGPDKGRSFVVKDDSIFLGRSAQNDVQMRDSAVSRRHLKILRRGKRYFIKDLESENGTFVGGKKITPGAELEIKEGIPIVIGSTVICFGEVCLEHIMSILDTIDLSEEINQDSGIFSQYRDKATEKIMELVYNVSDLLTEPLDVDEILEKLVEYIFDFLKKIDRAVIILVDEETGEVRKISKRLRESAIDTTVLYNREVVDRVIREGRGVMVSDVDADDEEDLAETLKLSKIESVMCVPLLSGSRIRGVIYLDSLKEPYGFRRQDLSLFTDVGKRAALAIENSLLRSHFEEGLDV
jgi:3',5'-cyclic-nucleotide phosphodiesterase